LNHIDLLGLKRPTTCPCDKIRFFNSYCYAVKTLSEKLKVNEDLIWTLAVKEGGWTDQAMDHNLPLNNPWGVNKTENGKAVGNKDYPSFDGAIDDWLKQGRGSNGKGISWAERVVGSQSATEFINNLQCRSDKVKGDPRPCFKYNSWNPNYDSEYNGRYEDLQYYKKLCRDKIKCALN
jgi:hypothetical protein